MLQFLLYSFELFISNAYKTLCLLCSYNSIIFHFTDFVKQMYPHNPGAVNEKLSNTFDSLDKFEGTDMANVYLIVVVVSEYHPEVSCYTSDLLSLISLTFEYYSNTAPVQWYRLVFNYRITGRNCVTLIAAVL